MTVVKLEVGGLLVHAPPRLRVSPCQRVSEHGDVSYIILPTVSGLEHKVFVGPFARCFPHALVLWLQTSGAFLNLPLSWLGFP